MKLRITVQDKVYDVEVEVVEDSAAGAPVAHVPSHSAPVPVMAPSPAAVAPTAPPAAGGNAPAGGNVYPSPLAGTIRAITVKPGDQVANNDELLVLEAMKMETSIASDRSGRIKAILVNIGDAVLAGKPLVEFE